MKTKLLFILAFLVTFFSGCNQTGKIHVVFEDDFSGLRRGPLSSADGAHTEYHYLHHSGPQGNWAVSNFRSGIRQNAWSIHDDVDDRVIYQKYVHKSPLHFKPMVVAGDALWKDYRAELRFAPEDNVFQSGLAFRYRNDRCYYFFGVEGKRAILKMVQHEKDFSIPEEIILAEADFEWIPGQYLEAWIEVNGTKINAGFADGPSFSVTDATYVAGKIALTANVPARFSRVTVSMKQKSKEEFEWARQQFKLEEKKLQEANPQMVGWKKIQTPDFGAGRNVRFGDLNNDGQIDVLIGQVVHHGPKDRNSELSCLTAITFDGEILWQEGRKDPWKAMLTNDVALQVHDTDGDGKNEVIYTMNQELIIADGATGKTIRKIPTPLTPGGKPTPGGQNIFERILGDCIFFCDISGKGYDSDIILKDRYRSMWAYNNKLELLWKAECNTGHYPYAWDIDGDGRDEIIMGYTLFGHDGTVLWTKDDVLKDHADGVAIVDMKGDGKLKILCAASDEGMIFLDTDGTILKHHRIGHVQNPATANFRDDLPGLETISINFWGNQGIIHFFDADGNMYHDFEPNQFGSMCLPLNWTGRSEEFFVHNPNVDLGGVFDGWGRRVLNFPDDGHPDLCNAVIDITGDSRDEIVVWDGNEMWVYTQSDNPKTGKLYKPVRNPQYNQSNYQASVSFPGWSE